MGSGREGPGAERRGAGRPKSAGAWRKRQAARQRGRGWAAVTAGVGSRTGTRNHTCEAQGLGHREATNDPSWAEGERVGWKEDRTRAAPSLLCFCWDSPGLGSPGPEQSSTCPLRRFRCCLLAVSLPLSTSDFLVHLYPEPAAVHPPPPSMFVSRCHPFCPL